MLLRTPAAAAAGVPPARSRPDDPPVPPARLPVPAGAYKPHTIMGKVFDPADPDGYVASFAIKRN